MDHIVKRIISLQNQVTTLPETNLIRPSDVVSYLAHHSHFKRLTTSQEVEYLYRDLWRRISVCNSKYRLFDEPLYYVAVYTPAYWNSDILIKQTVLFCPFGIWRDHTENPLNRGQNCPWKAYLWSTYTEDHNPFTSYESLDQSPDAMKRMGLVAEGVADYFYEYYTFPTNYRVNMERIDDPKKMFYDPGQFVYEEEQNDKGILL